jgi:hypothetical protein
LGVSIAADSADSAQAGNHPTSGFRISRFRPTCPSLRLS